MDKSIIVIGAGIAGLSAGCYGQMNGYRTGLYEMHTLPGGVCMTWRRYTSNWRGSFQGWRESTRTLSKTLPGLKDFYMAGQWVEPGGSIPTAVMSRRNDTQVLWEQDRK